MANKLYVGNLSYNTSEEELRGFFVGTGEVVSVSIITDKYSGRSKGFGFVEMASEDEARKAIEELNGKSFGERTITVQEARPQEARSGSSYGQRSSGRSGGYGDRRERW